MFPMGQLVFMFAVEHNILGVWYNEDNLRQEFDFFSSLLFVILSAKMKKKNKKNKKKKGAKIKEKTQIIIHGVRLGIKNWSSFYANSVLIF